MADPTREASMSFDRYTKVILTIIAIALCALVIENAIPKSRAQGNPLQKVQICDLSDRCLGLSLIRKRSPVGDYFGTFALPIFAETDER
jgi:hypothetical protein